MVAEIGDAVDFLGRFAVFWAFILMPAFRRTVLDEWRKRSRLARMLGLVDAVVTTFVGLFPLALLGAGIWWLA